MGMLAEVMNEIAFDRGVDRGRKEGLAQGEERGIEKSRRELVSNMLQDNQTPEDISRMTRQPLEYVLGVQEALLVHEEGRYRTDGKPSEAGKEK